jgi:predicted metal-dependent hydrolase
VVNPSNIFRSKRKTLSIYVDPTGELIVKAPTNLPDKKIFEFVKSRADWIRARQAAVKKNSYINPAVAEYNAFLFLGNVLTPVVCADKKVTKILRHDGNLLIPAKYESDKILKKVDKYLRDSAKEIIAERVEYFSQTLKLRHSEFLVNNNQTRWGSCSRGGVIAINWRAVMLKPNLLDYIVVHEFCHLLEFNHTKNFWAIVETILPRWRDLRKELKLMAYLLQLFR